MTGLILSGIYLMWVHLVSRTVFEAAYFQATNFLFWWYIVWSVVWGIVLIVLAVLSFMLVRAANAEKDQGKVGGLIWKLAIGGTFSVLSAIIFVFRRGLFIGGAYFLHTALIVDGSQYLYSWNRDRLFGGAILLVFALITRIRLIVKS